MPLKQLTMKAKILITLAALIVLSGCSNKISLVKRKYNKGYHFTVNRGKSSEQNRHEGLVKQKQTPAAPEVAAEQVVVTNNQSETILPVPVALNKPVSASQPVLSKSAAHPALASAVTAHVKNEQTQIQQLDLSKKHNLGKSGKASGDDLIIQIILALFPILCLIAVYLHDGKSITLNFWVDLILHITFIGEIIFALLVVLDVINLA